MQIVTVSIIIVVALAGIIRILSKERKNGCVGCELRDACDKKRGRDC